MKEAALFMHHADKDPAEAKRIAQESAKRIENRELKLLELVQSLGEYLTDDDTTVRAKAIAYLAAVLGELGPKPLSRQQVPVIAQFLCDRLEDETGLKEVASGLISLAKMQHFGDDEALQVMSALMGVDLPKHPPTTRFTALTLVDSLVSAYRGVLKSMGDRFIIGIAEMVGGEKDPRNLMIVFSVMKVILVEFDIVRHTELMFDVVYCYFPITFRPPPDDPYGITAQDLKLRLRECIASTTYFAGHVFPALIEKLDSTSQSVKMDILQTMVACALSYGPATMANQSLQLWDAVKFEVLSSAGDELANEALLVIQAIATKLSAGLNAVPSQTTPLARYLKPIIKECMVLLQEPQQKQAKPASQILASVATASIAANAFVIQSIMPALLLVYSDAGTIAKQRALMQSLNRIFESGTNIYGTWTHVTTFPAINNALAEHQDKLFEIYSQALMGSNRDETSFRLAAMRGLGQLAKIRRFLPESEIGMVVQYLDEIALEPEEKDEVRDEALQNLRDISVFKSSLIMQITFPAFMAKLPDSEEESKKLNRPYTGTLEALAKLSFERPVFEVLLTRLLNKLDVVLYGGSGPDYTRAILSTLLYVLQQKPQNTQEDTKAYYTRLIPTLLTKTIVPLVDGQNASVVLAEDSVIDVTGRLIHIIVKELDTEQQRLFLENGFHLFVNHKPSNIILENSDLVAEKFHPLEKNANEQFAGCATVFACMLAAVRRELALPLQNFTTFLRDSLELAEAPKSATHRLALLRIIGLVVNKWVKNSADNDLVKEVTETLLNSINSSDGMAEVLNERLRIVFWITKALLMRTDKYGMEVVQKLVNLLDNPQFGQTASRGFSVLLGEDELLNKENHAVVRMLFKQRTFALCVPNIIEGFEVAGAAMKPNYLIALSNIIRNVSTSVITPELPRLLPLLLQSADLPDVDVKAATIRTLHITITDSSDALKEHVSSVISRLLAACSSRNVSNPPRIRMAALRCLRSFPSALRNELLLPYKRQVLKMLGPVLDDPKRSVRKEAVDCRVKWFSMDEPSD